MPNSARAALPWRLDPSFNPAAGVSFSGGSPGYPNGLALQEDGHILVWGSFTRANETPLRSIARFNPDGSLDQSFAADLDGDVNAVAVQPDGKLVIGGNFTGAVARLNPDGSRDTTFNGPVLRYRPAGGAATVLALTLQPDGHILVGGIFFADDADPSRFSLTRLNADGSVDPAFVGSVDSHDLVNGWLSPGFVSYLAAQTNGSVLVGGSFVGMNSTNANAPGVITGSFARIDSTGIPDAAFQAPVFSLVAVASGSFVDTNSQAVGHLTALAPLADERIVAGWHQGAYDPDVPTDNVFRLTAMGDRDFDFNVVTLDGGASVTAIAPQLDGSIYIGGGFSGVNGSARPKLARLTADGTLDDWMAPNNLGLDVVNGLAAQPDGNLLLLGSFTNAQGTARSSLVRLQPIPTGLLLSPSLRRGSFSISLVTNAGRSYQLQSIDAFPATNWTLRATLTGNGLVQTISDPNAGPGRRFYRVMETVTP
ncbi:MAG TPA: delta-60 repeat domain-containing protein [Verrucomicrobiae bacterium]|nr:delta-60 repeat domain-containing protein [Verrucomicrobiae bacterium]